MRANSNDSFTWQTAGGVFKIDGKSPLAKKIAAAQIALYQKAGQLQFLIGEQKPHVQLRVLFLNECAPFRLPSRLEVTLPEYPLDIGHLFELGINTLVFSATPLKKEPSRVSWDHFYAALSRYREEGFQVALQVAPHSNLEEIKTISHAFDCLFVEEEQWHGNRVQDALVHEKVLHEIQLLEQMEIPLFYFVKTHVPAKALFQISFSVRHDTYIGFEAFSEGAPHPFFREAASHMVETRARLIPLFHESAGATESLLARPLFGAGLVAPSLPDREGPKGQFLARAGLRMWRPL